MDRSRRGGRQAAQLSPCAHGADEHPGIQGQIPHPHPVAQDGAAGKGTRGIHRDDANAQALGPPALGQGVGQRALARPWGTGDAKDAGPPGVGPELGVHYKSLFKEKGLESLVRLLNAQHADVLLMGGDYQEGCQFVPELFAALAKVKTPLGTYGVMGNNDYERCHDEIIREMKRYGMRPLEHQLDTLRRNGEQIILAGVRNPFDLANNGVSPTLSLSPADFVILLVHTPDYAEDVSVANSDLVLAGHTHGGQVRIFGYAPIIPSHYGSRFLTGLKYNSAKIPLIVTNGIGTSNKNIRIGAPAEIVMITLHRLRNE